MRSKLLIGLCCSAPAVVLASACFERASSIALGMRAPQGLLDTATRIELRVFDEADDYGIYCNGPALVGEAPDDTVLTFDLQQGGCASGASWCREIAVDKDDTRKVFYVVATGAAGPLAEGCAEAVVDKDPLEVNITVQRFNPPKCCNNGQVEVGEQCDTGNVGALPACGGVVADAVCDPDCQAHEILLTIDNPSPPYPDVQNKLMNGPAGSKSELAMAFSGSAGAMMPGALRAVYTDSYWASGGLDIDLRALDASLYPFSPTAAAPLKFYSGQLRLPSTGSCSGTLTQSAGRINAQKTPAIASVSADTVLVAYASDEVVKNRFDVWLSVENETGCAPLDPVQVNVDTSITIADPDVAQGPVGTALIVWRSGASLRGRIRAADGSLTPAASDLDLGGIAQTGRPRVAGSASGWLVVRAGVGDGDPDGIVLTRVSAAGSVVDESRINAKTNGLQDQPDVAVLEDGRSCAVWRSDNVVMFQRFTATGGPLAGDQNLPLQVAAPAPASDPVIERAGGFFAAAWGAPDGTVWARYIGGTDSFGYNTVTGQNGDFKASHPAVEVGLGTGGQRSRPAIAVAGYVVFGWQDVSPEHPGIYVRRFPLPLQ
ncbi:MAG: hypothetical protein HY908_10125 [Myxococcales bacterium]|nr:hypothetical protein [Myxococcales bacterium]